MKDYIRIRLIPTEDSALVCCFCFGFQTELALQPDLPNAIPMVGIHTRCVPHMHAKRGGTKDDE